VVKLVVGEGEFQAGVVGGRGGRGRGRGRSQVAALDVIQDGLVGAAKEDGAAGGVNDHVEAFVGV